MQILLQLIGMTLCLNKFYIQQVETIPGVRFAIVGNIKYNRKKLTVADNDSLRKWEVEYEYDAGTG